MIDHRKGGDSGRAGEAPPERLVATFGRADVHRHIGELIRSKSTNKGDIYRLALDGIGFDRPVQMLDLGCGWGAFTEAMKGVATPGSSCTGIDWIEENRTPYLNTAESAGLKGDFICGPADTVGTMPDRRFDIVLSGFSLYFFARILPEISRVLKDDGVFVAITHSEMSLGEFLEDVRAPLMHAGPMTPELFGVEEILREFNSENGTIKLKPHFGIVERIEFINQLRFAPDEIEMCFEYLKFKRCIITGNSEYRKMLDGLEFHEIFKKVMLERALRNGVYTLTKDDAIFRCRGPRSGGSGR